MKEEMIKLSEAVRHIWNVYKKEHENGQFSHCNYIGFDMREGKLRISYEKVHRALMDDDGEWIETKVIVLDLSTMNMDDEGLKRYFVKETRQKETMDKIRSYERELKRLKDGINKFNLRVAKSKAPDYLEDKIKRLEGYAKSWMISLNKQKNLKKELEKILKEEI